MLETNKVFFWACDYSSFSGEGRLARLFIKEYKKKNKFSLINLPKPKNKFLNYKYIIPLVGILYAWLYFFKGKKFIFLNYLPYWNFVIFLVLPPKCEIGPITGGAKFSKNSNDYLIRKLIFPMFYMFSNFILKFRFKKLIFSTELLKKFLTKDIIKKSKFNFIFKEIDRTKKSNKTIKFLFYFRKHKNKDYTFIYSLIKKISSENYKIHIIGDRLNLHGVKNHGFISHKKVLELLKLTKYSICSSENIFSFFTIDCINNNVKILIDAENFNSIKCYKNNFVKFNFENNNYKNLK
jgi:hypothetical protein